MIISNFVNCFQISIFIAVEQRSLNGAFVFTFPKNVDEVIAIDLINLLNQINQINLLSMQLSH